MPHITAALTIPDAIPTNRTFNPRKMGFGTGTFEYSRTATDLPRERVVVEVAYSESSPKRPTTRTVFTLAFPVLRTVGGVQVVDSIARAECTFIVPDTMLTAEAEDLVAFMRNSLSHTSLKPAVTLRDPIWG